MMLGYSDTIWEFHHNDAKKDIAFKVLLEEYFKHYDASIYLDKGSVVV